MKLSELISKYKDHIKGGKGDTTIIDTLDKKQLAVGVLVEKEHTSDLLTAMEIACDHLTENPKYYSDLIDAGIVDEKPALDMYKKLYGVTEAIKPVSKPILDRIKKLNVIIAKAKKDDISGIEPDATWESVYDFEPITINGKFMTIMYKEPYEKNKITKDRYNLTDENQKEDVSYALNWVLRAIKKGYKSEGVKF